MNANNELTLAIRAYVEAKNLEKAAKAEAAKRQAEILSAIGGETKVEVFGTDGVTYGLTASTSEGVRRDVVTHSCAPSFAANISSRRAFIQSADIVEHLLGPPTMTPTSLSVAPSYLSRNAATPFS